MAEKHTLRHRYPPRTLSLVAQGAARPAQRDLSAVLAKIGPRHGPISDAGTRALQKQREPETAALEAELVRWPLFATSSITSIEVTRAVARARSECRAAVLPSRDVQALLGAAVEMVLTDRVRRTASTLAPLALRTLDAIHLASALALGRDLAGIVTYDLRLRQAAERQDLTVLAPA